MKNNGVLLQTIEKPRALSVQDLRRITDDFSKERIIGSGGYGVVYKGELDGEKVALKKLRNLQWLGDDQFNECINLMGVQHQNIVRLIGYCYQTAKIISEYDGKHVFAEEEVRALCLEYLQGGSLDVHLSEEEPCRLDWCKCYGIIKGISEGLKYLHTGSRKSIFHLDLKPANILLDRDDIPKIGDFGLSRLGSTQTFVTKEAIGTFGYMPPEYIDKRKITSKFDVFSLGVIILEIVAGRSLSYQCAEMTSKEFIKLVHEKWEKRLEVTIPSNTLCEVRTCIKIALRCVDEDRAKRPTIAEIVDKLNKIDISKSSSRCELTDFGNEQDSSEQCSSLGYQAMPRRILRSSSRRTVVIRPWLIRLAIWLSVAAVLAAITVVVLRLVAVPNVKAVSLLMLMFLFGSTCLWIINRLAIWLRVAAVLTAIIVLVSCFIVIPEVKADIEDARNNSFAVFTSGTASFFEHSISVAISVRNPKEAISVPNPVEAMSIVFVDEPWHADPLASSFICNEQSSYAEPLAGTVVFINEQRSYAEPLACTVVFNEQRSYNDVFTSMRQTHPRRKVRVYLLYYAGQVPPHVLGASAVDEYMKGNVTAVFNMDVRISMVITIAHGDRHTLSLSCPLSLRIPPVVVELS